MITGSGERGGGYADRVTGSGAPDAPRASADRARSRGGELRPGGDRARRGERARSLAGSRAGAARAGAPRSDARARSRRRPPSRWRSRIRGLALALLALVLVDLALVLVDAASGLFYRTGTASSVALFRHGPEAVKRAVVVLPGFLGSGREMGAAFRPYLGDGDAVIAADYGERGVDLDDVERRVRAQLALLRPAQMILYGPSLGGVAAAGFLQRYAAAGAPFGKVSLVLDTAPASEADVMRPSVLLWAGCYLHGGMLSSVATAAVAAFVDRPAPEPGSDPEVIAAAHRAGAWRGTAAATTQACFIHRSVPPVAGAFDTTVLAAAYLHGVPETDDPTVDVPEAIGHWRVALPGLRLVALPARQGMWHVTPVERPRETLTAILAAA
jgi:hypothetical protein